MRRPGTTGIALAEDLQLVDGRPAVDLLTGEGQMSLAVPVPVLGGAEGTMIYVPPKLGQVVTAVTSGTGSVMVPLASWPPSGRQGFQDEQVETSPDEAYPAKQHTKDDIVIMHQGNKIVLDNQGRLVIHTSGDAMRLQVPDSGAVHLHRGEDVVDSHLALADPVADAINALTRSLSDLVSRVTAIELALLSGVTAVAEIPTAATGFGAIGAMMQSAPLPGGAYAPSEIEADAIASPAIVVSSETKEG